MLVHESDFWVMVLATVLAQLVNLVFLASVFARVPTLNGWSFWAVLALFGIIALSEGIASLLFEGTWRLAANVNLGSLDYMVVRPFPVPLQVTSQALGINGLTNVVNGGLMLGVALARGDVGWSVWHVPLAAVVLASAVAVRVAINLAANAVAFWLTSPTSMFAVAVHQAGDLAKFPLSVYPAGLRLALGVLLPFAFVGTFPMGFVLAVGDHAWLGLLTPLVAVYCWAVALFVFRLGLRRYESAGS
ncbi:ABC transporter permease [Streptomyces sp. 3MP-14]|uniref:ABC transporter permease n=2 Tax=Streptomyces TaxID=1883 RepID=A0A5N5ZQS0_9ACTN|nr:ABC transporter permease [Streptomyces mimosae]KAB8172766.1 ABC transporter permease [Streptomyces sp. 3MP-14]